jgi:hypothetical protein
VIVCELVNDIALRHQLLMAFNQPQDVSAATFFGITTRAVTCVELIDQQMRLQFKSLSSHKGLSYRFDIKHAPLRPYWRRKENGPAGAAGGLRLCTGSGSWTRRVAV